MSGNINSATYVRIRAQKSLLSSFEVRTIAFIIGHIPLSFLLSFSGWAGAVHAILVLFIGMRAAVHRNYDRVLAVLAYIAGAELLWRMTSARIFWEYGKYASIALAIFTILVSQKRTFGLKPDYQIKLNPALIFYLAFLLPSVVLTFDALDLNEVRRQLSFNLSGPLAITVLGLFLWQYSANRGSLVQLLLALVAPIVGILTLSAQ
ncbi:MAG: hypothetical protein KDE09_19470, partial [Anaerolineales bacterium]|nr:hypothetical protein [Anaerolineales bacterium]